MRYHHAMRTTLSIDDDVLDHARARAEHENRPLGSVVSDLMRRGLKEAEARATHRNGFRLLPYREGPPVTLEMINKLRDEEE